MLNLNDNAPAFCLPNQDGVEICLRDFIGKWVVLYFYPKDNTPGCTSEACDFTDNLSEFLELDAMILGVSADSVKKHQNFIAKHDLAITLLSDENQEVLNLYGVWQMKKNYGREYLGIVRSTFLIDPKGVIRQIWNNVKVKGHVNCVKAELEKLQK